MTAPASHCCRALQRHIIPSRDAVWITDSLLATAFERYCIVSKARVRRASNVPGPLESQRRLGRRRMGDTNAWHCPPTPPPWAFPVPLNLSKWTWEPPSLAHCAERDRLASRDDTSTGNLESRLRGWLQQILPRDAEEPPISFSVSLPDMDPVAVAPARNRPSFAAAMEDFLWAVTHATDGALASYAYDLCGKFEQLVFLGEIGPDDVMLLASEIWGALESRFSGSPLCNELSLSVSMAILTGAATSKVFAAHLLGIQFWRAALAQLAKFPAGDELCDLFVKVMTAMPAPCRGQVSEDILAVLNVFFSAWSCSEKAPDATSISQLLDADMLEGGQTQSPLSGNLRHARAISRVLQSVGLERPDGLLDAADRLVLNQAALPATGLRTLRYNWLCVLALMPQVNQDRWFDLAVAFADASPGIAPMTGVELCSLLLVHWKSRGYLKSPGGFYRVYKRYRAGHDEAALASLSLAIFRHEGSEQDMGLYRSTWRLLTKLNQADDLFRSLEFSAASYHLPLRLLQNLAWHSGNHRVVIRFRDWYMRDLRRPRGPEWDPSVFGRYARRIVLDPSLPPKEIWRVLDINSFANPKKSSWEKIRRHRGEYGKHRVRIAEKVATAFADAPHLPNRVAFRHTYQAFRFIEATGSRVPFSVIQGLYHVVTRDLHRQQPGRTRRLLWLVSVIQRVYGVELAWKCRVALRRWRLRLKQIWLGVGNNSPRR